LIITPATNLSDSRGDNDSDDDDEVEVDDGVAGEEDDSGDDSYHALV
jgi:hypothetical protein